MTFTKTRLGVTAVIIALLALSVVSSPESELSLLRAQGPPQAGCSVATLRGAYGNWFQFLDAIQYPFGGLQFSEGFSPGAGQGTFTFDGNGNLVGQNTFSFGGAIVIGGQVTGTYTVNSNCTGSMALVFQGSPAGTLNLVIVDNGRELHTLSTTPGTLAVGTMKKQ